MGRANIISKYIFFNFGHGFCGSFLMLFPKAPVSCCKKKFELIFVAMYFYIFKILFQTGEINTFVLRGVFFCRYVHLKRHFKNISGEITWQSIKGKFDHWQKLELCKVIHSAELH